MKRINYRLQTEIENIKPNNQEWFKDYVRQVLESEKPYYVKADYLGLSIQEIQNKIDYLSADIKEMTAHKKSLAEAKAIALEATATVLAEYGIDRLDGASISSITITPAKTKIKENLNITNEEELIKLGYFNVVVDEKAVKEAMHTLEGMNEINNFVEVGVVKEEIPAKIRVNTKRNSPSNQAIEILDSRNLKVA